MTSNTTNVRCYLIFEDFPSDRIHFSGFPHNRKQLQAHDPDTYAVLENLWMCDEKDFFVMDS